MDTVREAPYADRYLLPVVQDALKTHLRGSTGRVIDMGCGEGFAVDFLCQVGYDTVGFDLSGTDIALAKSRYPTRRLEVASVYDDDLPTRFGAPFDAVVTMEVAEHLFEPARLLTQSYRLLREGGLLVLSTPYHGYLKNLALSLLNQWDAHHGVEWTGGHIKFFSKKTMAKMATEAGYRQIRFCGVGRLPWLWKSMILIAEK